MVFRGEGRFCGELPTCAAGNSLRGVCVSAVDSVGSDDDLGKIVFEGLLRASERV